MNRDSKTKIGSIDLTVGKPSKVILKFTLPLLLGNIFQLFYSWSDAIMLGNVNKNAVQFSALTASIPIVNLLQTFVLGFLAGAVVVLGQFFGKGDFEKLKKSYSTLLVSMLMLTTAVSITGFLLAEPLLRLIKVNELYIPYAKTYLQYYFAGLIFVALYNTFAQSLRSIGNSTVPFVVLVFCVLLNTSLDVVFIAIGKMNVEGVALSTVIAQFASAVILFLYIQFRVPLLRLKPKELRFEKNLATNIFKLGIPSTIQTLCACVGFMVINGIINSNGPEFTTAFGLGNRVDEILSQINNSFGAALGSYAAQNKGKGDNLRIKQGYRSTMIIMVSCVITCATLIYIFRNALLNLFVDMSVENHDLDLNKVLDIANVFLSIYLPSFFMLCCMSTTSSLIRGTGAAKLAMTVNFTALIVRVISALILNQISVYGAFFASPIGWSMGMTWAFYLYFKGKWAKSPSIVDKTKETAPSQTVE